ncbi:MAG: hypothetical protein HQL18_01925 [Candidatus Omnitrophica bacterium]|nr:hypothetical protein [Candidatus Omnitrophota bacterium]
MSRKEKQILWHKKQGKGASVSAVAVHGSQKGGRLAAEPQVPKTRAQVFLQSLKQEIKKAV